VTTTRPSSCGADEVRRRVDAIIDNQEVAMKRLEDAGAAFDRAVASMHTSIDAIRSANDAQMQVVASLRIANREALQILRTLPQ
jgi:hypothetical protein